MIDLDFYRPLFNVMLNHRYMSVASMRQMFFGRDEARRWNPKTAKWHNSTMSLRAVNGRVATLVKHGFLVREHQRFPNDSGRGSRTAYCIGPAAKAQFPRLVKAAAARNQAPKDAGLSLLRSSLLGALVSEGWSVGRGGNAAAHLRRYLLDSSPKRVRPALRAVLPVVPTVAREGERQRPLDDCWFCKRCRYRGKYAVVHIAEGLPCPEALVAVDIVPFDVFFRIRNGRPQAGAALFLGDLDGLPALLRALPIWSTDQVALPVLTRLASARSSGLTNEDVDALSVGALSLESAPGYAEFEFQPNII